MAEVTLEALIAAIKEHAAHRGMDRCWEEDRKLYQAAGLTPPDFPAVTLEDHRRECDVYRAGVFGVPMEKEPVCQLEMVKRTLTALWGSLSREERFRLEIFHTRLSYEVPAMIEEWANETHQRWSGKNISLAETDK